jgi:hypothetical protein
MPQSRAGHSQEILDHLDIEGWRVAIPQHVVSSNFVRAASLSQFIGAQVTLQHGVALSRRLVA